jgi:hypothetical protein
MDYLSPSRARRALSVPVAPPAADHMRQVIAVGLAVTLTLVVLQAATQAIDFGVFNLRIWAFNCDKRYSVFGLASLFAQLAVAAACLWRGRSAEAHRGAWLGLGALVGVLILIRGLTTFNAKLLAVPLACVFLVLCWLTFRDAGPVRATVWSGFLLLAASLLLHKVGLGADDSTASDFTWAYQITSMIKHGAELAGWMLLATGVVAGSDTLRRSLTGVVGRLRPQAEPVGR